MEMFYKCLKKVLYSASPLRYICIVHIEHLNLIQQNYSTMIRRKITLSLVLISCFLLSSAGHIKLWAQGSNCFRLECESAIGATNEVVEVDIIADGFTGIASFQFSMKWDAAVASLG